MWRSFFGRGGTEGTRIGIADRRVGRNLKLAGKLVVFCLAAGTMIATAQAPDAAAGKADDAANPVAQVRNERGWEYGPFANWGSGVGVRSDYKFFWGGFELGKVMTPVIHAGFLSGQFQLAGNIMPLWLGFTPPPHEQQYTCQIPDGQLIGCTLPTGGGTFHGVSLTPVIFRWNLATKSRRIQPWIQAAGGLIYTTHKYPPNLLSGTYEINGGAAAVDGGTSVWNFSPQGGGGIHIFLRPKRSIDIGVNGMHLSSASLGDRNPGVNGSVQVQVGYTFWR